MKSTLRKTVVIIELLLIKISYFNIGTFIIPFLLFITQHNDVFCDVFVNRIFYDKFENTLVVYIVNLLIRELFCENTCYK